MPGFGCVGLLDASTLGVSGLGLTGQVPWARGSHLTRAKLASLSSHMPEMNRRTFLKHVPSSPRHTRRHAMKQAQNQCQTLQVATRQLNSKRMQAVSSKSNAWPWTVRAKPKPRELNAKSLCCDVARGADSTASRLECSAGCAKHRALCPAVGFLLELTAFVPSLGLPRPRRDVTPSRRGDLPSTRTRSFLALRAGERQAHVQGGLHTKPSDRKAQPWASRVVGWVLHVHRLWSSRPDFQLLFAAWFIGIHTQLS